MKLLRGETLVTCQNSCKVRRQETDLRRKTPTPKLVCSSTHTLLRGSSNISPDESVLPTTPPSCYQRERSRTGPASSHSRGVHPTGELYHVHYWRVGCPAAFRCDGRCSGVGYKATAADAISRGFSCGASQVWIITVPIVWTQGRARGPTLSSSRKLRRWKVV